MAMALIHHPRDVKVRLFIECNDRENADVN